MSTVHSPSPAFTRAEFLILAGLAVILVSLVLPGLWALRQQRRIERVREDMQAIVRGMDRFFNEYHTWPSALMGTPGDVRYGHAERPNREIINVLRGRDAAGNETHRLNPNRIPFLEFPSSSGPASRLSAEGDYLDPWGTPYQIVVDTDADENCHVADSVYGFQADQDLLVWSCGPDRLSDTADDILGWRRRRAPGKGRF